MDVKRQKKEAGLNKQHTIDALGFGRSEMNGTKNKCQINSKSKCKNMIGKLCMHLLYLDL